MRLSPHAFLSVSSPQSHSRLLLLANCEFGGVLLSIELFHQLGEDKCWGQLLDVDSDLGVFVGVYCISSRPSPHWVHELCHLEMLLSVGDQDLQLDLLDGTQTTCVLAVTVPHIVPEQDLHAQPPISVLELGMCMTVCIASHCSVTKETGIQL